MYNSLNLVNHIEFFSGTIKAIGVSNYSENDLDELLEYCSIKPHVNQCEFHVCYNNKLLIEYCRDEKIVFTVLF